MAAELNALKLKVAAIEGTRTDLASRVLPLGIPDIDAALRGGIALGAVHEIEVAGAAHRGAAFGFALALASLALKALAPALKTPVLPARHAGRDVLWIETASAAAETGKPYALGFAAFGLSPAHLVIVRVTRPGDLLWVLE